MKIKKSKSLFVIFLVPFGLAIVCLGLYCCGGISRRMVHAIDDNGLSGKKVLFDGDSIAAGSAANADSSEWSYADYLVEEYGILKTNISVPGAKFYRPNATADCDDGSDACHIIPKHLTTDLLDTSFDYIILEGAINDLHSNYRNDKTSYATELRKYFSTVTTNEKWSNAKIGFVIVPRPNYNVKTNYIPEEEGAFWKEVQDICDEYSIGYINFFKQSSDDSYSVPNGFDWNFMNNKLDRTAENAEKVGTFDGIHPTKGAHRVLGEYIAQWMTTLPSYKYTVTLDANGGKIDNKSKKTIELVHNTKVTNVETPVFDGRDFMHWSKDNTCESEFDFGTVITNDMTLFACYGESVASGADDGAGVDDGGSADVGGNVDDGGTDDGAGVDDGSSMNGDDANNDGSTDSPGADVVELPSSDEESDDGLIDVDGATEGLDVEMPKDDTDERSSEIRAPDTGGRIDDNGGDGAAITIWSSFGLIIIIATNVRFARRKAVKLD